MEDQAPFEWRPRTLRGRAAYEEMRRQSALPPPPSNLAETATFAAAVVVVLLLFVAAGTSIGVGISIGDALIYGLFLDGGEH